MKSEHEMLNDRINELEYLNSKHKKSEKILKHALCNLYKNMEKRIKEHTVHLITINRKLRQEISDHLKTEYALYYRAEFERLIATLSTNFIKPSEGKIHIKIKKALQEIGKFIGVDRGYMFLFSEDRKRIVKICEWCARGIKPQIQNLQGHLVGKEFPWLAKRIKKRGVFYVGSCDMLPPEASAEKEYFQAHNIQSIITIPMFYNRSLIGCLGFDSVREKKTWAIDIIVLLKIVGEIFTNSLERNCMEEKLRNKEKNTDVFGAAFRRKEIRNQNQKHIF